MLRIEVNETFALASMKTPIYVLAAVFSLLIFKTNYAQNFQGAQVPDSSRLKIVIPAEGDTIAVDRVRYAAATDPAAKAWVQGEKTRVYPSGAFVGLVPLEPGWNNIVFQVQDWQGVIDDTIAVFRKLPHGMPVDEGSYIDKNSIEPKTEAAIMPGDLLEVEFWGSPGGTASFNLDEIAENVKMTEITRDEFLGHYTGSVRIPDLKKYEPKPVEFKLKLRKGGTARAKSTGLVHILPSGTQLTGVTADSINIIRTQPDGIILMELPPGIRMQVVGERNGIAKVQLDDETFGYISFKSLKMEPTREALDLTSIKSIVCLDWGDWLQVRVNLSQEAPFRIEQVLEPPALDVTFYRAHHISEWITNLPDDKLIKLIKRTQEGNQGKLHIELNQRQQWGVYGQYVGKEFCLNIRKTPHFSLNPNRPLEGLTIAVDPGHGGENQGARGATGLEEKAVNLRYALQVADLLEKEGAKVIRTRTVDTTMTLANRMELARKANAHLFVWLHNNAVGFGTDPLRGKGTSTYYTAPQSMAVASAVYARLLSLGLHPYGRITSTYFVTRQTDMLTFLVEGAFISHPEDEMLLLNDRFLSDLAQAVANGIRDFVLEQASLETEPSMSERQGQKKEPPGTN